MNLAQKYKPRDWSDVVGQPETLAILDRHRQNGGLGGRAYWLAGPSGSGKTTIADLLSLEVAGASWAITVYDDPSQLTASELEHIRKDCMYRPMGKGSAYVVNEAHGLRRDQVRKLLGLTDTGRIPSWVAWVFTTTNEGQASLFEGIEDIHPMMSRCEVLPMRNRHTELAFALRAQEIATAQGLNGQPLEAYLALAKRCKNNLRAMLAEIGQGAMM